MSTRIDNAMLPRIGRIPPALKTPRGNFYRNTFEAMLWHTAIGGKGANAASEIPQDEYIDFILFTQDVPAVLRVTVFYPTATAPDAFGPTNYFEYPLISDILGLTDIIVADDPVIGRDEHATGLTATAGVRVSGYVGWWFNTERDLFNIAAELTAHALLMCISSGAVQDGPVASTSNAEGGTYTTVPIILHEPDYTQAIQDDGDKIIIGTTTYEICGLWLQYDGRE